MRITSSTQMKENSEISRIAIEYSSFFDGLGSGYTWNLLPCLGPNKLNQEGENEAAEPSETNKTVVAKQHKILRKCVGRGVWAAPQNLATVLLLALNAGCKASYRYASMTVRALRHVSSLGIQIWGKQDLRVLERVHPPSSSCKQNLKKRSIKNHPKKCCCH